MLVTSSHFPLLWFNCFYNQLYQMLMENVLPPQNNINAEITRRLRWWNSCLLSCCSKRPRFYISHWVNWHFPFIATQILILQTDKFIRSMICCNGVNPKRMIWFEAFRISNFKNVSRVRTSDVKSSNGDLQSLNWIIIFVAKLKQLKFRTFFRLNNEGERRAGEAK